jgi:hypothetical protein
VVGGFQLFGHAASCQTVNKLQMKKKPLNVEIYFLEDSEDRWERIFELLEAEADDFPSQVQSEAKIESIEIQEK